MKPSIGTNTFFGQSDLIAARELIPVLPSDTVRNWVEKCFLAGLISGFEMEALRNLNQGIWHTKYMLEAKR